MGSDFAEGGERRLQATEGASSNSRSLWLLGSGNGRDCYAWPGDPGRCIKVPHTARGLKESVREARYLTRMERLYTDVPTPHVARFLGCVETTRGPGWTFERVRDERDDLPAPILADALDETSFAAAEEDWRQAFESFIAWMASTPLVIKDVTPANLCVARGAHGRRRFVVIDGVGPSLTLARWLPLRAYARRRNPVYVARRGLDTVTGLLVACRHHRERRVILRRLRAKEDTAAWLL